MLFDVTQLILSFGYVALFAVVFSETGLLVGFFLPGDTLLFTAGVLASQGVIDIAAVIAICFAAAVLGDSFGYYLGRRFGKKVFTMEEPHFLDDHLNKENLERTRGFFKKYGAWTIFIARYVPIVRTIAPTLAGTADMPYTTFLAYNVLGGLAWTASISLLGYFFGGVVPHAIEIAGALVVVVVTLSLVPMVARLLRKKKR